MKRNIVHILSVVVALSLILSLGACGIWDRLWETDINDDVLPDLVNKTSDGRYLTVEDFMKDFDVKETEEELETDTEEFCEDVSISFSDNQMIYTFVFRSDFADKVVEEYSKEEISATLFNEEKSREFVGTANLLASVVAADDLSVLIVYKTPDGTVLASQAFYPTYYDSGSEPTGEASGILNDFEISIVSARAEKNDGEGYIVVVFEATNISDATTSCDAYIDIVAYQGGIELTENDWTFNSIYGDNFSSRIKPGTTITFEKAFYLRNAEDIEVEVETFWPGDFPSITRTFNAITMQ